MNNELMERLKKNSKIDLSSIMSDSSILGSIESVSTPIYAINIAFSGRIDGGFSCGLHVFAGQSKVFKSCFSLICAKAYLDKYDDAVMLFYDSEMGASESYFKSLDIDMNRVMYTPITNIEELKFDIVSQLQELKRGDHVIILVDSIGNLASKKEIQDAIDEKSVADMSRAKSLKSLTRMVTPYLNIKNIPMIVVNHVYNEIGTYTPQTVMSGGTGLMYSADTVLLCSRTQNKQGTDLLGYNFSITVMKGRHSREKAKIPVTVNFDGGVNPWSGLLDMAVACGLLIKSGAGWYQKVDPETGEVIEKKIRGKDTNSEGFWSDILESEKFKRWVSKTFGLTTGKLMANNVETSELMPNKEFTNENV